MLAEPIMSEAETRASLLTSLAQSTGFWMPSVGGAAAISLLSLLHNPLGDKHASVVANTALWVKPWSIYAYLSGVLQDCAQLVGHLLGRGRLLSHSDQRIYERHWRQLQHGHRVGLRLGGT
jgi:hypothetical protein